MPDRYLLIYGRFYKKSFTVRKVSVCPQCQNPYNTASLVKFNYSIASYSCDLSILQPIDSTETYDFSKHICGSTANASNLIL